MAKLGKDFLTQVVKYHAAHYADAGWDVVIEATPEERLMGTVNRTRSVTGAVNAVREAIVAPWVDALVEAREGGDDEALKTLARLRDERTANQNDATLWWPEEKRNELLAIMGAPDGQGIARIPEQRNGGEIEIDFALQDGTGPAPRIVPDLPKGAAQTLREAVGTKNGPTANVSDPDAKAPAAKRTRQPRQQVTTTTAPRASRAKSKS